jgi:hypothetical protein
MGVTCWRCGEVFNPETSAGLCPNCGYNVRTRFARLRSAVLSFFAAFRKTPWHVLKLMAVGAVSFWLPDSLWHAIRGSNFNGADVLAITVLLPLTLLAMYLFIKRRPTNEPRRYVGLAMMLGVWMLGGFFITVGSSFSGGGFVGPDGFRGGVFITLIGLVPPFTYVLATYDASLGALLLATLAAILIGVKERSRKRHQE